MKKLLVKVVKYGKILALFLLVVVAGCSYSCGRHKPGEQLTGFQTEEQEESRRAEEQAGFRKAQEQEESRETEGQDGSWEPGKEEKKLEESQQLQNAKMPCFVHVCGEVENPGVYEMKEGQRVFEAVDAAGGFSEEAVRDYLNLAELVWDGMKLEVPNSKQVPDREWTAPAGGSPAAAKAAGVRPEDMSAGKVNINTATKEELITLRGIGEAKAEDIIRYRQQRGGFERIEDIMEISGIKNAAFEKIKDDITV